jgi:hypothetical protein
MNNERKRLVDSQRLTHALAYVDSQTILAAGGPKRSADNAAAERALAEAVLDVMSRDGDAEFDPTD